MDNSSNQQRNQKTPKELSLDRLDEVTWRALAALSQTRLTIERDEQFVIVARVGRGNIQATAYRPNTASLHVCLMPDAIEVHEACEFCGRTAVGTATFGGTHEVTCVCDRCAKFEDITRF